MKRIYLFLIAISISIVSHADEGMWLPSLISQRIADMQAKGFKLSAEDIYSINQASLKDAVALFGRGCTGELVSDKGLLLTNHHCGYGQIQAHSSLEHDYLKDGFWAMSMAEELPNPGLTVSFLERMEDVTGKVLEGYQEGMSEEERIEIVDKNSKALVAEAIKDGNGLRAQVEALYYGNQYFIFIFREYSDVRLVGAPPSSIGKFGGDTDNWMWPRHTGDFSIFRVYADKDNNPAAYSKDNIPYTPKRFFKVSTKGVKEGDFTFVYGFPGSTMEYVTSDAVQYVAQKSNPHKIALRTKRLEAQEQYMSKDRAVKIMYSSKNANVSNAWKKWQGEMKGILDMNTIDSKKQYEASFREWAKGGKYEGLLDSLSSTYDKWDDFAFAYDYYRESVNAIELPSFANRVSNMLSKGTDVSSYVEAFYKDFYLPIDKSTFISLVSMFAENVPDIYKPSYLNEQLKKYSTVENWAENLYASSLFVEKDRISSYIGADSASLAVLSDDPMVVFSKEFNKSFERIADIYQALNRQITLLYRDYMKGQMEFEKDKVFYPDANLTLRVAYGKVSGYSPKDGITYLPSSTIEGIMQKDNPEIFDYDIPQALRDIYAEKDYGRWAVNGTIPVCFIATNHTTGGNSGSPIINADGELIGLNFDRVWEGTMSDIAFNPEICRNISLDVRYVLFIIDKLAKATHLLEEMGID